MYYSVTNQARTYYFALSWNEKMKIININTFKNECSVGRFNHDEVKVLEFVFVSIFTIGGLVANA